jgi:hypothetical protein
MPRFVLAALAAALLGASSQAQPYAIHMGGGPVKATPGLCARKAVEAMGKEKFLYACVTEDGHALGWTASTTVLVWVLPQREEGQTAAIILAAGRDNEEAGRLRIAVRNYMVEAPTNPGAPEVFCPLVAFGRETTAPSVRWKLETRDAVGTAKHFVPVASLAFEKQGWKIFTEPGKQYVLGAEAHRVATALMAPGSHALKLEFAFAVFGDDEEACGRVAEQLHSSITKMLFD